MTQEEKQLLLKDLCARLLYGTIISYSNDDTLKNLDKKSGKLIQIQHEDNENVFASTEEVSYIQIEWLRPYLRPMSSMTDEELMEFGQLKYQDDENWEIVEMRVVKHDFLNIKRRNKHNEGSTWTFQISRTQPLRSWMGIDWLNAHHFDFRGLIEKGLALEAPDGMYKED